MESNAWTLKVILFAMVIMVLTPILFNWVNGNSTDSMLQEQNDELLESYKSFTNRDTVPSQERLWCLSSITTPYSPTESTSYAYSSDGWLYGTFVNEYLPYQYSSNAFYKNNVVSYDANRNAYYYNARTSNNESVTTNDGHTTGDLYTTVAFDVTQKSDIFFTSATKHESGDFFYYEYTGYRYSFTPIYSHSVVDKNGNEIALDKSNTSLSMVWYDYYGDTGLSGQLILTGGDKGVAYLTSSEIIQAYTTENNTAKFTMTFNGVPINIYIRISPWALSHGMTIEQCWNEGLWEVMVTSIATDSSAYSSSDYSMNPSEIWETLVKLFTFNTSDYNVSSEVGLIMSLLVTIPLYAILLSLCVTQPSLLIIVGVVALIQALTSLLENGFSIGLW